MKKFDIFYVLWNTFVIVWYLGLMAVMGVYVALLVVAMGLNPDMTLIRLYMTYPDLNNGLFIAWVAFVFFVTTIGLG